MIGSRRYRGFERSFSPTAAGVIHRLTGGFIHLRHGTKRVVTRWLSASVLAALCSVYSPALANGASVTNDPRIASIRARLLTNPDDALREASTLRLRYLPLHSREAGELTIAADWMRAAALAALNKPADAARVAADALKDVDKQDAEPSLRGELLLAHGHASSALGRVTTALTDYQTAYKVFGRAHLPRGQAIALQHLAATYSEGLDYEKCAEIHIRVDRDLPERRYAKAFGIQ